MSVVQDAIRRGISTRNKRRRKARTCCEVGMNHRISEYQV